MNNSQNSLFTIPTLSINIQRGGRLFSRRASGRIVFGVLQSLLKTRNNFSWNLINVTFTNIY